MNKIIIPLMAICLLLIGCGQNSTYSASHTSANFKVGDSVLISTLNINGVVTTVAVKNRRITKDDKYYNDNNKYVFEYIFTVRYKDNNNRIRQVLCWTDELIKND